jgi:hypothetical protein
MPVTSWGESLKDHCIPPHVNMIQALLDNGCFHPSKETWVASADIKRTYDTFLAQLDMKEERHIDVNVLMRSLNAIFNMRPQARTFQKVQTHKGWWFPNQGAICKALRDGKLLSLTVEWVDTWQRLDYKEDSEGPWIVAESFDSNSKGAQPFNVDQECSCCLQSHGWLVRRDAEGHMVTRIRGED